MNTTKLVVSAMLAGLVGALCAMHGNVIGKTESSVPLKVGVVDLDRVMQVYPLKVAHEKKWSDEKAAAEAEIQKLGEEVEGLVKELDTLDPQSDVAKEKRVLAAEKQARFQVRKASAQRELMERYKGAIEVIYNDVLTDVEKFRKEIGYDLIIEFYKEPVRSQSLDMLQMQMMRKVVLASSNALDLTDKAIDYVKAKDAKK